LKKFFSKNLISLGEDIFNLLKMKSQKTRQANFKYTPTDYFRFTNEIYVCNLSYFESVPDVRHTGDRRK